MNISSGVGFLEGLSHSSGHIQSLRQGHASLLKSFLDRPTFDVLHDDEGPTRDLIRLMDLADVGMFESTPQVGLANKASSRRGILLHLG